MEFRIERWMGVPKLPIPVPGWIRYPLFSPHSFVLLWFMIMNISPEFRGQSSPVSFSTGRCTRCIVFLGFVRSSSHGYSSETGSTATRIIVLSDPETFRSALKLRTWLWILVTRASWTRYPYSFSLASFPVQNAPKMNLLARALTLMVPLR